ncbi:hypothetical protein ABCS02_33460 [Microbacterium sp. X-17]|uniref:AMP-binding enzyme n=1 Tax=Microbacterium sp. X-17 TaxID=3144404 RepID=UPI0031F58A54
MKGELQIQGPSVMMGYHNNDIATAESRTADGWLRTGDIAVDDGFSHFRIVDRLKDMIIAAGYNIYPAEIERVLVAHESVSIVAVGRVTDPIRGEVARAYVVLATGAVADADGLLEFARSHLAAYKEPRAIHFMSELPTTSSGRIIRRLLAPPAP